MAAESARLKGFLLQNLYRHPDVMATTANAQQIVRELFAHYMAQPDQLPNPPDKSASARQRAREVADYLAGMTDRFATREHERITGARLFTA